MTIDIQTITDFVIILGIITLFLRQNQHIADTTLAITALSSAQLDNRQLITAQGVVLQTFAETGATTVSALMRHSDLLENHRDALSHLDTSFVAIVPGYETMFVAPDLREDPQPHQRDPATVLSLVPSDNGGGSDE